VDILGSGSPLADAEVLCVHHDALAALGLPDFRIQVNSRRVLAGLLEVFAVPAELGAGVLTSLDKLDKMSPADVTAEITGRGLGADAAAELVGTISAPDAAERIRTALKPSDAGMAGLDEVDRLVALVGAEVPAGRVAFEPRMVRGLSYYTGPIWEVSATGASVALGGGGRYDHLIEQLGGPDVAATGTSLGIERILMMLPETEDGGRTGRIDVAVTVLGDDLAAASFALAGQAREAGLRASVYMGSSGKLGRQLKWASDSGARWCLIYGAAERDAGTVIVRDMAGAEQEPVPAGELTGYLAARAAAANA
jgi:histidyl-tRNA synthetase